jgi:hypothetical protein
MRKLESQTIVQMSLVASNVSQGIISHLPTAISA